MTPELVQLAGAAGVTAGLIFISYLFGAWRSADVSEASALERLAFDEPDFRADALLVGADGKSAIAADGAKGEGALVFALGDSLATRRFKLGSLDATAVDDALVIALKDVSKWRVAVTGPPAAVAEWARRVGRAHAVP
jgi:hypothetical protein